MSFKKAERDLQNNLKIMQIQNVLNYESPDEVIDLLFKKYEKMRLLSLIIEKIKIDICCTIEDEKFTNHGKMERCKQAFEILYNLTNNSLIDNIDEYNEFMEDSEFIEDNKIIFEPLTIEELFGFVYYV